MRQVFGEISISGDSSRKHSRNWAGTHPSRSGYLPHSSNGDNNNIPLKNNGASSRNLSLSGSTTGLRDWENEKESGKKGSVEVITANKGIMKTVNITQS